MQGGLHPLGGRGPRATLLSDHVKDVICYPLPGLPRVRTSSSERGDITHELAIPLRGHLP